MKGETGEYSIQQAIKQLGLRCQGANLEKGGWKEELLTVYPDGRDVGWWTSGAEGWGMETEGQKLWEII